MLEDTTVVRVRPGAIVRRVKEESVVLVLEENRFLAISEVGARTLELLDGRTLLADVLVQLRSEYDVDPERLAADVHAFLEQLIAAKVVEEAEPR